MRGQRLRPDMVGFGAKQPALTLTVNMALNLSALSLLLCRMGAYSHSRHVRQTRSHKL